MAAKQLYSPKQRSRIWIALFVSIVLHGAAVALAEIHRDPIPFAPTTVDPETFLELETLNSSNESPPPPDLPDAPERPASETTDFIENASTPPPRSPHKNPAPIVRPALTRAELPSSSQRALATSAPRPEYPYEARRDRITGDGVALLTIDAASGRVLEVTMSKSTGNLILDQAAIAGFRRWRFKAGTVSAVRCPITYTLTGAHF